MDHLKQFKEDYRPREIRQLEQNVEGLMDQILTNLLPRDGGGPGDPDDWMAMWAIETMGAIVVRRLAEAYGPTDPDLGTGLCQAFGAGRAESRRRAFARERLAQAA